jgi:hypothetical protein
MKPQTLAVYLNCLNDLKTGLRILRMIQGADVCQLLEMEKQPQTPVKLWREIVEGLSEWCRMN